MVPVQTGRVTDYLICKNVFIIVWYFPLALAFSAAGLVPIIFFTPCWVCHE